MQHFQKERLHWNHRPPHRSILSNRLNPTQWFFLMKANAGFFLLILQKNTSKERCIFKCMGRETKLGSGEEKFRFQARDKKIGSAKIAEMGPVEMRSFMLFDTSIRPREFSQYHVKITETMISASFHCFSESIPTLLTKSRDSPSLHSSHEM